MTRPGTGGGFSVAIVGVGPRGLSVLERLMIRLRPLKSAAPVTIWVIDPVEHGSGRIWRTQQPDWFTMNATAGEVTAHSPDSDMGHGGLAEWSATSAWPGEPLDPLDYPPRRVYGAYLHDTFVELCRSAPPHVAVRPVFGEVTSIRHDAGRFRVAVNGDVPHLSADKIVLATGHGTRRARTAEDRYLHGDIAPDMPFDEVPARATVAVRGLGLSFYDITRALTIGRGGEFIRSGTGQLRYQPSGQEPQILAGSRTGLPFLARTRFDSTPETAPRPTVFTSERLAELRATALTTRGTTQLDFAREVEPLIHSEVHAAYGAELRLSAVANPFADRHFTSSSAFRRRLLSTLRRDVGEARKGIGASPLKAALETLRAIRPLLPDVVDFGGLLPASHRDFLERFAPWSFILSAGPPDTHVEQLTALIEADVVTVMGPSARFGRCADKFAAHSPNVGSSHRTTDFLVEARIPPTDIRHSASPLTRQLLADGVISEFVNANPISGEHFATGGMAITAAPCRVIDARGIPNPDVYAVGVATEHTRWFTQVGTGRPGQSSPFCQEADAIAADILRRTTGRTRP